MSIEYNIDCGMERDRKGDVAGHHCLQSRRRRCYSSGMFKQTERLGFGFYFDFTSGKQSLDWLVAPDSSLRLVRVRSRKDVFCWTEPGHELHYLGMMFLPDCRCQSLAYREMVGGPRLHFCLSNFLFFNSRAALLCHRLRALVMHTFLRFEMSDGVGAGRVKSFFPPAAQNAFKGLPLPSLTDQAIYDMMAPSSQTAGEILSSPFPSTLGYPLLGTRTWDYNGRARPSALLIL